MHNMRELNFILRLNHATVVFHRHFLIFYITLHLWFHYFVFPVTSTYCSPHPGMETRYFYRATQVQRDRTVKLLSDVLKYYIPQNTQRPTCNYYGKRKRCTLVPAFWWWNHLGIIHSDGRKDKCGVTLWHWGRGLVMLTELVQNCV